MILPVHITVEPETVLNRIRPAIYGACIEDVNHEIYGGLYAQQVFGESFEEPAKENGVSGMWGPVGKASFSVDTDAFNGEHCQKIVHGEGAGLAGVANLGLNRWGIAVRKGHAMEGRIYLRGDVKGAFVALQSKDGSRTYASERLPVGGSWTKAPFRLKPSATDPDARFAVLTHSSGTLWVDQAVLLDSDRFHALPFRGDIGRAIQAEGVRFLRYGGSMVNAEEYRWKKMIGDPDRRPPYRGTWYPYSTNVFGIFDFLRFCDAAKIGAAFAINIEETPQDAADLADYLTAPVSNPWGRKRAEDGHPAPYHPEYIEIGNEEGIGRPDEAAMAHYAERFKLLAGAIHGRNPKLKLVCGAWWVSEAPQMKTVFDAIDGVAAAWDFHFWCDELDAGKVADRELDHAEALFKSWSPKTNLKVVVFEENGNRHDFQRALGHAAFLNATRRHGDFVIADCAANCLQPLGQNDNGWDQGGIFFTPDHAWLMPPAQAHQMLSSSLPLRIAASTDADLDVTATRTEDGKTIELDVVNLSENAMSADLNVRGYSVAEIRWLQADLKATNPPNGVPTVALRSEGAGPITFRARSLTVVSLAVRQAAGLKAMPTCP